MMTIPIYAFIFFMSSGQQKPIDILPTVAEAEAAQVASLYAPPYDQPVKKKKIFFIEGLDPKKNEK